MTTLCTMCGKPIRGETGIITVGPCIGDPGTKFYHPGCLREQSRQRIASSTPGRPPEEAGENP